MQFHSNSDFNLILNSVVSILDDYRVLLLKDSSVSNSVNIHGESSLQLDLLANELLIKALKTVDSIYALASEEDDDLIYLNPNGKYIVCFDPLDGSSLVGTNQGIGLVFGIYKKDDLYSLPINDTILYSFYIHLGQVNSLVLSDLNSVKVFNFYANNFKETTASKFLDSSKYFSLGNLKFAKKNTHFRDYIDLKIQQGTKLRYFGCLISDFHFMLSKNQGVFFYLADNPDFAKLRLMYEIAPLALILKNLNAVCINHKKQNILDLIPNSIHDLTSVVMGSKLEVDLFSKIVLNNID